MECLEVAEFFDDDGELLYRITFNGASPSVCTGQTEQTWSYTVEEFNGAKDISNWAIQLCDDPEQFVAIDAMGDPKTTQPEFTELAKDGSDVDYSPEPCLVEIDVDRSIKWETEDDFESGEFTFTLVGCFEVRPVWVAIKTGGDDKCLFKQICGPACEGGPTRGIPFL